MQDLWLQRLQQSTEPPHPTLSPRGRGLFLERAITPLLPKGEKAGMRGVLSAGRSSISLLESQF